jgi:threonine dehydrogenase-like Zn-dependent dehydrogenase
VAAAIEAAAELVPLDGAFVLIAGAGMLGLTATAMAVEAGARVVVSEPIPERRESALAFGAAGAADPAAPAGSPTGLAAVLAKTGGRAPAPTVALELSGSPAAARSLLDAVDVGGVLVLVGQSAPGPDLGIAPEALIRRLITIRGVHNYAARHLEQAVRFLSDAWQRYPFAEQVGETFALADVDAALAARTHPRVAVRP